MRYNTQKESELLEFRLAPRYGDAPKPMTEILKLIDEALERAYLAGKAAEKNRIRDLLGLREGEDR